MKHMKYLGILIALTSLMTASNAGATLAGTPPAQPAIDSGCQVTVYYSSVPFAATSGKTSLTQSECSTLNVKYPYENNNLGIRFGGYGADPISVLTQPTTTNDLYGNLASTYSGISLRSANEIVALTKLIPIPPPSQLDPSQHFLLQAGYAASGKWFGASGAFTPPPPPMCQPVNISFGNGCVYQTKASVPAGTVQQAQSSSANYTGSVTATCTNSGQYEYRNFTCTYNPPPPPPPVYVPDYSWYNFSYFYW